MFAAQHETLCLEDCGVPRGNGPGVNSLWVRTLCIALFNNKAQFTLTAVLTFKAEKDGLRSVVPVIEERFSDIRCWVYSNETHPFPEIDK